MSQDKKSNALRPLVVMTEQELRVAKEVAALRVWRSTPRDPCITPGKYSYVLPSAHLFEGCSPNRLVVFRR
jgi:hypothetical protein